MNGNAAFYAPLTSAPVCERDERPTALWLSVLFIAVVGIGAIVALRSDCSLTPDQRAQVFQQSGMYP